MKEAHKVENNILTRFCGLFALVCLGAAGALIARYGISIDTLFVLVICLTLAGIFSFAPMMAAFEVIKDLIADSKKATPAHSHKTYYFIWLGLIALTGIEIVLIFPNLGKGQMMMILIGLSLIKSAMIVAYFMHLKFERRSLVFTLIPITLILFGLFGIFFPDSSRALYLGVYKNLSISEKTEVPKAQH